MNRGFSEDFPHKRINQFPCEHVLTVKDLLCIVARRAHEGRRVDEETLSTRPIWLPTTFNLKTELAQFVAFYRARQAKGLDNLWIVKPWNLARSLDTHVTDQLDMILRLSVSGPKVVQKYIERPVLFHRQDLDHRVKFDVRYIILLSSVKPLKAYAYKRFWLRFANKPFELDHFDEYERHFTVMNYTATTLHKMLCHDFIHQFEEQYPNQSWATVEGRIFQMLSELLQAATKGQAPGSIVNNPQSRAMYAVDLMLQWTDTPLSGKSILNSRLLTIRSFSI
jgi:tubulin--tyrosine ligase-like protein 12